MIKRHLRFVPLALALLGATSVHAAGPQLDIHKAMNAAPTANAGRRIETSVGTVASVDEKRGVPTFLWVAPPDAAGFSSRVISRPPEEIAHEFVAKNLDLYGLSGASFDTAHVREVHDTGTGGLIVIFAQKVDGVDVWRNEMKVLIDRQGDVIAVAGNLHGDAISTARGGAKRSFNVPRAQAIANAFADNTGIKIQATNLVDTGTEDELGYRRFDLAETPETSKKGIAFSVPSRAKKVLYAMPDRLVPAYYLELSTTNVGSTSSDLWGYVVSAEDGELLERDHLKQDVTYSYKVYSDTTAPFTPLDGPIGDWTPHPTGTPDGSFPPYIAPVGISLNSLNLPGDPWLTTATNSPTTGNNVDAYADIAAPDHFSGGDVRPSATGTTFNFAYDTSIAPGANVTQRSAAVVSLFFLNNWLHDYFYDSGFNEAAGNAQTNNFGRGGAQNDSIRAEAQDYSGTDNANMQTPADGQQPTMQMYVFTGPTKGNLTVNSPLTSLGNQAPGFGPNPFNTTADLILASDGTGPDVNDICEAVTNNITGKIALIKRGTCTFESKVLRAQQAGAVGVLIMNNVPDTLPGMADDPNTNGVTIGSLGIYQTDGNWLNTLMGTQTVNVTMSANPKQVDRDGSIDNHIVSHEWGHYLHHRLVTTCPTYSCTTANGTFSCGQCGGESEGWGDFVALHMMTRNGDNIATGTFGASVYASAEFGDSAYFGIRRFAYSRDFAKNALTFRHISNGGTLPTGTPQNGAFPDLNEVHNTGEVWAMMLYQAYTQLQLYGGHTFDVSKRRMADYIVAGMKLSPNNPTFTQQRDGILAAARATDLNDAMLLADGFAARGAGTCAISPAANLGAQTGVVEDFDNVGVMQITGTTVTEDPGCDNDGVVDAEETGKVNVSVFNSGIGYLNNTTVSVTSGTAGVIFPGGNSATIPSIAPGATGVASIPVGVQTGTVPILDADFAITANNATACVQNVNATATAQMNYDNVPTSSATEEFESPLSPWNKWGATAADQTLATTLWTRQRQAVLDYWYNGADYSNVSDTALESPNMTVAATGNLTIAFTHSYNFDFSTAPVKYWDGGVVELTQDGGANWIDIGTGYNGALQAGTGNPLAGRNAYSRTGAGTVTLNLGTTYAGKTIKIRFRIGTDNQVHTAGQTGWFIDTIAVTGITNTPFWTIKTDPAGCSLCASVVCTALDQCHDVGVCNPSTGVCSNPLKANGSSCNDGNACTQTDTCQAGTCTGTNPVVCTASDQCHDVGVCNTTTGVCTNPNKANGTTCSDGNACTQTDTCQAGTCTGTNPVTCTASDQCHDVGTCNTSTGVCSNPTKANGSSCSDGNACTTTDTCQAGTCTAGAPVVCTALDQCHDVGVCNTTTGVCSNPNKANGTTCSDGNACTQTDSCQAGTCTGTNPVTCTASDQCHDVGTCNTSTGVCSNPPKANGSSCSDGNACTTTDTCQAGTCTAGAPVVCTASDQCHDVGVCNTSTGVCSNPTKANGSSCSDGNACTQTDSCQAGTCTGTNPVTCTALDQCHDVGTCNTSTGVCSNPNKANGSSCSDGNACTQTDSCQAGTCTGTNPVTCTASDQCHDVGTCNTSTGVCSNPTKANGSSCSDGNACTTTDTCQAGTCTAGAPVVCTASDQCHNAGVCNTSTGVCSNPNKADGSSCNDNSACTQTDTCQAGTCTGSNPVTCAASDQCHVAGTCDPMTGTCNNPTAADGTACNDNSACTQTDTCQAGTCTGTNPVTCAASDQCHVAGTCDPMTGACTNPTATDGTTCDDNNSCTLTDTCQGGTCTGMAITCNTPDECHDAGTCNTMLGICQYPNKADGTPCTNGTCQGGVCNTGTGGAGGMGGTGGTAGTGGMGGTAGTGGMGGTAGTGGMGGTAGMGGMGGTAGMGGMGGTAGMGGMGGKAGAGGTGGMSSSSSSSSSSGMGGEGGRGGAGGSAGGPIVEGGCDCASTTSSTTPNGSALLVGLGALVAGLRRRRKAA